MNPEFAAFARSAAAAGRFERGPRYCSRWVRQCVQAYCRTHNHQEGQVFAPFGAFGVNANESGRLLREFGHARQMPPVPGDLVVWNYRPDGHIEVVTAVRTNGSVEIAGNATGLEGRTFGSVGIRVITPGGAGIRGLASVTTLGRLPLPRTAQPALPVAPPGEGPPVELLLGEQRTRVAMMPVRDGTAYAPAHLWARALGVELGWDAAAKRVIIGGKRIDEEPWLRRDGDGQDRALLPVRTLAAHSGLAVDWDAAARVVTVYRAVRLAA